MLTAGRCSGSDQREPVARPLGYLPIVTNAVGDLLVRALRAHRAADPERVYDEVLASVAFRAKDQGSLGKDDIGALVLWKRITAQATWANKLMMTPEIEVRGATEAAFEYVNDSSLSVPVAGRHGRRVLSELPGMGWTGSGALASAVLLALAPTRMAVWDRRVARTLSALGRYASGSGFYSRYLSVVVELAEAMGEASPIGVFVPRDVDLALFHIAGSKPLMAEAEGLA
jgi:hypothetical protein